MIVMMLWFDVCGYLMIEVDVVNCLLCFVKEIVWYNKLYYDNDVLEVLDVEYDVLVCENVVLEVEYLYLVWVDLLLKLVGVLIILVLVKVVYVWVMFSFDNVFVDEDVVEFVVWIWWFFNLFVDVLVVLIVELKIDGLLCLLWYENGVLV